METGDMAKLLGRAVGEQFVEILGPITGRNYNVNGSAAPVPPQIRVRVVGSGTVQLQEAPGGFVIAGTGGGLNGFSYEKIVNPAAWVNLGAPVSDNGTFAVLTPTIHPNWTAIRAIVTAVGAAEVIIETDWV